MQTGLRHLVRSIAVALWAVSLNVWLAVISHAAITIPLVEVGVPNNPSEPYFPLTPSNLGVVGYVYNIGKFEVTNIQYASFLNSVAKTDANNLYNSLMDSDPVGGITRSGASGSYIYSVKSGFENKPVVHVSFYDGLRFVNWLQNGQPIGLQDSTTTEYGSYDMSLGGSVVRLPGAQWVLPNENEWVKAGYFQTAGNFFSDYPFVSSFSYIGTDPEPPAGGVKSANIESAVGSLTDVGSYSAAASSFGTYDQLGNVWEWNETPKWSGTERGVRGGSYAVHRSNGSLFTSASLAPTDEIGYYGVTGFRVANLATTVVPEPSSWAILGGLGLSSTTFRATRRRK